MKKIYKYGTGDEVPKDAIFLSTITQEVTTQASQIESIVTRLVWHYFLVETDK